RARVRCAASPPPRRGHHKGGRASPPPPPPPPPPPRRCDPHHRLQLEPLLQRRRQRRQQPPMPLGRVLRKEHPYPCEQGRSVADQDSEHELGVDPSFRVQAGPGAPAFRVEQSVAGREVYWLAPPPAAPALTPPP